MKRTRLKDGGESSKKQQQKQTDCQDAKFVMVALSRNVRTHSYL